MVWIAVTGYTVRCCCFSYLPILSSFIFLWKEAGGSLFHVDCNRRPASYTVEDKQPTAGKQHNMTTILYCLQVPDLQDVMPPVLASLMPFTVMKSQCRLPGCLL